LAIYWNLSYKCDNFIYLFWKFDEFGPIFYHEKSFVLLSQNNIFEVEIPKTIPILFCDKKRPQKSD
jgi:hypothetical protein